MPGGAAHGFGVHVRGGGSAVRRQPLRLDGDGGGGEEVVRCPAAGMPASPARVVWPAGRLPGKNPIPVIAPGFVKKVLCHLSDTCSVTCLILQHSQPG